MRISLVPALLRQPRIPGGPPIEDPWCRPVDEKEINRAAISGLIVAGPDRETGDDGEPVTVLSLSFATHQRSARCQVEAPDVVADPQRRHLQTGRRILVVGELTGGDSLRASFLRTWGR